MKDALLKMREALHQGDLHLALWWLSFARQQAECLHGAVQGWPRLSGGRCSCCCALARRLRRKRAIPIGGLHPAPSYFLNAQHHFPLRKARAIQPAIDGDLRNAEANGQVGFRHAGGGGVEEVIQRHAKQYIPFRYKLQAKNTGTVFDSRFKQLYQYGMDDLKSLREALGMTQTELAEKVGTSQPQIRRLEAGDRELTRTWAERLAPALRTTAIRLLFPDAATDPSQVRGRLISWVSAGALLQPDYEPTDDDTAQWVYAPDLDPAGDWIVLRVDGDSMNRISPHDSLIFVNRKDKRLVPNACYVIGDGDGGATYKRYRPPNTWEPVSTNPSHKPMEMPIGREPEIVGRVKKTVLTM